MFGQIAAANSLSDVYAMGGEPKVALNIVGFPNCLDPQILGDILAGGADKVKRQELFWLVDIQYRMMSRSTDFVCPDLYIQRRFLRITDVNRGMC